jgi:uncharacterized protein (UPF0147 family)
MKTSIFLFVFFLFLFSCSVVEKGTPLTDKDVKNYIEVYKNLRKDAPKMLENINSAPESNQKGLETFNNFEKIIKNGGIKDYATFVMMNAKIGSIFSILQAESGMQHFENLSESSGSMLEQGIAEIEKILADPNIPEEIKIEHRKTLQELEKSKSELNQNWDKNKPIAAWVLEKTKQISGLIVTENDILIVKKYEKEIMEAYVGFPMPKLPDGKMPELKFDN